MRGLCVSVALSQRPVSCRSWLRQPQGNESLHPSLLGTLTRDEMLSDNALTQKRPVSYAKGKQNRSYPLMIFGGTHAIL